MDVKVKESLQEKYEVIGKAADDCTYILMDSKDLSSEELEHKLYTRFDRINAEMENIGEILKRCFAPTKSVISQNSISIS